jgi:hypothetical protein
LKVTKEVVNAAHAIGLFVRVIVSDMGASNQDMWRVVGVQSTRTSLQNGIEHPCQPDSQLYFMADPPHLLKSIRNCLLTQSILLSDYVVSDANLPSNIVSLQPVKELISLQEDMSLKVAHKLKEVHVYPGPFQKMKVSYAAQLLSHSTASALKLCVDGKEMPIETLTTAFFLETINQWFDSMNARHALASLFASSERKIEELEFVMILFQGLHFSGRDGWKPIQTGVRLSTQTVLCLYQDLVVQGPYKYLMTGRLTQDCVENLFSQIRSKGDSHPSPVHFRYNLRLISLSQYMRVSRDASYEADDSTYFLDFLKTRSPSKLVFNGDDDELGLQIGELVLSELEGNALYTLAGWAVFKEKAPNACAVCVNSIIGDASSSPELARLNIIKSFETGGGLTHPSPAILQAVIVAETIFRNHEDRLMKTDNVSNYLLNAFDRQFSSSSFPSCHNIVERVIGRYFRLRLHIYGRRVTNNCAGKTSIQHGSRSAHCRTGVK